MDEESAFKRKLIIAAVVVALAIGGQLWWNRAHPPKTTASPGTFAQGGTGGNSASGAKSVFEAFNFTYTLPSDSWMKTDANLGVDTAATIMRVNPSIMVMIMASVRPDDGTNAPDPLATLKAASFTGKSTGLDLATPAPHNVGNMAGWRCDLHATVKGANRCGVMWYYTTNGFHYAMVAMGQASQREAVAAQAEIAFRGFALIDPARRATPANSEEAQTFQSRYGYRVEAKAPHWTRFDNLTETLPGFEFGLVSKEQGGLAAFAADLQGTNPGLDALNDATLELAGWRREARRGPAAKDLKAGALTGATISFEGEINKVNHLLRHKLLRGSNTVYFALAWVDKRHANPDTFLEQALATVILPENEPATRPKLEEGDLNELVLAGGLMNLLGLHYHQARQYSPARGYFRIAFESKKDRMYLVNFFLSSIEMRQYDDTLKYLDGYATWLGEDVDFLARRAYLQARCGQAEAALKNYTTAFNASYESTPMMMDYLRLLINNDRADWATTKLEKYLKEKDTLELRLVQSVLFRRQKQFNEAVAMLKEQEKRYSFSPALSHEFIACYYDAGRHKDALDECARLLAKGYDSAEAHIAKARSELALKAYRQAKVSLEMALEKDPANNEAREYLRQIPTGAK